MAKLRQSPMFFEIAWEVCNQVGGIYTVIKTKAPTMLQRWGSNYFFIGPYNEDNAAMEFEETPVVRSLKSALEELQQTGIKVHFGRWLIEGRPYTLLFEVGSRMPRIDEDKYFLWKDHGISAPIGDYELDGCVAFGFAVTEFFKILARSAEKRPIVAQFHEWQASVAIFRLKHQQIPVISIFTTHATLLGRYLASDNKDLYSHLYSIDPYGTAVHYNIVNRFLIEKAAAHASDFATTVSDVTAREVSHFLGRQPSAILPNGINLERFTVLHEFQNLHKKYKDRLYEFVMSYFFPSYTFDLDRTLFIFTSGRYEYRNKGMDIFIEALFRLNKALRALADPPTVVAFIITKAPNRGIANEALRLNSMFEEMRKVCQQLEPMIGDTLLAAAARGRFPSYEELLPADFRLRLRRAMHARQARQLPRITTHDMIDDAHDAILNHLRARHLFNSPNDPVKVVFHPEFITDLSPLFSMDYNDFVRGCHLGVFPSYYEPWGYTPMECLARGIPTVTSDLSGFGDFAKRHIPDFDEQGIHVLRRSTQSNEQVIEDLSAHLTRFAQTNRRERIEMRYRAERTSVGFGWSSLARYYYEVQQDAVKLWHDRFPT